MKASTFIADKLTPRLASTPITAVTDAMWRQYISDSQQQIALWYNWKFMQRIATVTVASGEIALPVDFKAQPLDAGEVQPRKTPALIANDTDKTRFDYLELENYPYREDDADVWSIGMLDGKIYASTNQEYTFMYQAAPPMALTADTHVFGIESDLPYWGPLMDAIADLCIHRALQLTGQIDNSQFWWNLSRGKAKTFFAKTRNRA